MHTHVSTYTYVSTHLLVNESFTSLGEPGGIQMMQFIHNGLHVPGPHVLGGIDSEAGHPDVNEVVQILSHLGAHVVFLQGKVKKTDQTTVSDLWRQEVRD